MTRLMEERLEKHRDFLVDRVDPDFGLLDKLLANKTLTTEDVHEIKLNVHTTERKNRILLELILKNKKADELIVGLRDIGQNHLVNYLNSDGEHESAFGDDWPLTELDISLLNTNRESLVDLLDTSDLCIRLFSEKIINNRQKQFISSKPTDAEKNEALLEILTKCSLRQYKNAIVCLNDSNQGHIAKTLSDGGVLVRVHVNLEGAVGNVDEVEEEIISQFTMVLENHTLEEANRLWGLAQQRIIAAKKGQSIIIYIHSTTHDDLLRLIDLLKTDKLKEIIEKIFTKMLKIGDALRVTLTWSLEEFKRAAMYFESEEHQEMAAKDLHSDDDIKKQEVDDITTCCICTEVYTDPKALPCIHTFCMKCIQETGLKTNKGPGDEMPCPICRRLFKIPIEGFPGLPKHFFIERLIQVSQLPDRSVVSRALCSVCLERNEDQDGKNTSIAYRICVECKRKLCETCCSEHTQNKLTRSHSLMPISEYKDDQIVTTDLASSACELHKQRVLDVYCVDCKTVVCANCFIDDHKYHEGSHVDRYVDEFWKQIESNEEAMNKCKSKAQMRRTELLEVKEDMLERMIQVESDVTNRIDELKQLIDKHATSLLESLYSTRQVKLKEIQMTTDDIDAYLSCLETYNSYCQKIMANGSASDICGAFSDLMRRSVELQQQCQPTIDRDIQSINFRFRKSELGEVLDVSCDNLIGKFEENQNESLNAKEKLKQKLNDNEQLTAVLEQRKLKILAELRYGSDPVLVQTIDINSERKKKQWFKTGSKDIRGMTILDKELFVVSYGRSEVVVYDSMDFSLRRRWDLKELIDPLDIVSCERNKCLYINDYKGTGSVSEIFRVNPAGKLIKKWSDEDGWVLSLSVTYESNVILVNLRNSRIKEYSSDGQLIRKINLSPDASRHYLLHAIKLINGDFVTILCSDVAENTFLVSIVDANGNLKKSIGGKHQSSIGQLYCPSYLSVDANGFVMVADRWNGRILSLDSDLEFKKEIVSKEKHGLRRPWRIILDEINGRLFVADNELDNQRILIFDFK